MKRRLRTLGVLVLLLFMLLGVLGSQPPARAQSPPTIAVFQGSWSHTQLTVLLATTNSSYVLASVHALRAWEIAVKEFATSYSFPSFDPLTELSFVPYVQGVNASLSQYDIVVQFASSAQGESSTIAGEESSTVTNGVITGAQITVALGTLPHTSSGLFLGTMQTVVAHEVGHALGLGHTPNTVGTPAPSPKQTELMNPFATVSEIPTNPSTLDVYALATRFAWLFSGNDFPTGDSVSLGPSIPYRELGLRTVTIVNLPIVVGSTGEPAIISESYPQGYQIPSYVFDNLSRISVSGVNYTFLGWDGFGGGSYSGTSVIPAITVEGNVSEIAVWSAQNPLNSTVRTQSALIQDQQAQLLSLDSGSQQMRQEIMVAAAAIVILIAGVTALAIRLRRNATGAKKT